MRTADSLSHRCILFVNFNLLLHYWSRHSWLFTPAYRALQKFPRLLHLSSSSTIPLHAFMRKPFTPAALTASVTHYCSAKVSLVHRLRLQGNFRQSSINGKPREHEITSELLYYPSRSPVYARAADLLLRENRNSINRAEEAGARRSEEAWSPVLAGKGLVIGVIRLVHFLFDCEISLSGLEKHRYDFVLM